MSPNDDLAGKGRDTRAPPRRAQQWRRLVRVLSGLMEVMISDRISLSAAGCAFYVTLALFPALSMLVFLYGLMFNPHSVESQLDNLRTLVPPPIYSLITTRVHSLVTRPGPSLTIGFVASAAVSYWSASWGTKAMLSALNLAYGEEERRGIIGYQLIGLGMTFCAVLAAVLGLATLVGLPHVIGFFGLSAHQAGLIKLGSVVGLLVIVLGALVLLYRYGPSRAPGKRHVVLPGAIIATVLWVAGSALFSVYVDRVARYNVTYGPLAAAVGVMMWFWVSAYVVLFGAELNAALENTREGPK